MNSPKSDDMYQYFKQLSRVTAVYFHITPTNIFMVLNVKDYLVDEEARK